MHFFFFPFLVLRGKLARIFDACILAKTCKENCNHLNKAVSMLCFFYFYIQNNNVV